MLSTVLLCSFTSSFLLPVLTKATSTNTSSKSPTHNLHEYVVQQGLDEFAPLPILEIGLEHILSQIGENATQAGNDSMSGGTHHRIGTAGKVSAQVKGVVDQCGPGVPCVDGSCCNSVRQRFAWRGATADG